MSFRIFTTNKLIKVNSIQVFIDEKNCYSIIKYNGDFAEMKSEMNFQKVCYIIANVKSHLGWVLKDE